MYYFLGRKIYFDVENKNLVKEICKQVFTIL